VQICFFLFIKLHGTRVSDILRAQPGGSYCSFSGFLFDFGFWVFFVKPNFFVKRPNLKLTGSGISMGFPLLVIKNSLYFRKCSLVNHNKLFHYY